MGSLPKASSTNHTTGAGYVPYHAGDYVDAIKNKKATTHLLVHETLGGMCPYSARRLRRLARDAATSGCDATDYTLSSTACSFVPYYAQRISSAIVMNGAQGMLDVVSRARRANRMVDLSSSFTDAEVDFRLTQAHEFIDCTATVRSQLRRAARLYRQFVAKGDA